MGIHVKRDGRIFVVYTENKKRKWKPFGRGDIARLRAEAFNREIEAQKGNLEFGGPTVGVLWSAYREKHHVEESTYRNDGYKMTTLTTKLGGFQADLLTTDHLHRYVAQRTKEGVKRATIANEIRRLKAVLNWACNENPPLLLSNPIAHFRVTGIDAPNIPMPPTICEVRALIDHAQPHCARALRIFWSTGIRPGGEMFRMRWTEVDLEYDSIRVQSARKKGPAIRNVPISEDLKIQMLKWREEDKETFGQLFPNCPVVHFRKQPVMGFERAFARAKLAAGISRRIRPYDFRHAFASIALRLGADLKSVSEVLGHASPDTTAKHYQHVTKAQHREVILKIPGLSTPSTVDTAGKQSN